ncbi:MAG: glycosyltransferase WbuB [Gammaproteobacteria bacterium]
MKILIYGINYLPELTGIGKYTGGLAEWLAARGHEVHVITAPPYYPNWEIEKDHKNRYATSYLNDVQITRVPIWVPKKPSALKRLIHLSSFLLSSVPALWQERKFRPDIVFLVEPPLVCAPAAIFFAKCFRAASWLHVQDFEVDAAFSLGILRSEKLKRFALRLELALLYRFNIVSSISGKMISLLEKKGVSPSRIFSFPNWADVDEIHPLDGEIRYRSELKIKGGVAVFLYSGNMGHKQGLELLGALASALAHRADLHFVFCGNGPGRAALEDQCSGNKNVSFLDLQPKSRLCELLNLADVHLLPQREDAADLVMPSKLTGILASGRPVIVTARADTELARVVAIDANCGLVVPPGDIDALVESALWMIENPVLRSSLGIAGRVYAEKFLSQKRILQAVEEKMLGVLKN